MHYDSSTFFKDYWTCEVETDEMSVMSKLMDMANHNNSIRNNNFLKNHSMPEIKNVIFNPPATIVIWEDDTKTIVKQQPCDMGFDVNDGHEVCFDKEKGLAMAICKKVMGNKGNYNNIFNKWIWDKE